MISILIVGPLEIEIDSGSPDVEVLRAGGPQDAVEKLARNRRIDAILLLSETAALAVLQAIREENCSPPPVFVAAGPQIAPPGTHPVPRDPVLALEQVLNHLE
jgi:ABC-type sugar transport system substrate-binding protein